MISSEQIVTALDEIKRSRHAKIYPQDVNRLSSLAHPCERYLCYCRTHWKEKSAPDINACYLFDIGNETEPSIIRDLAEIGKQVGFKVGKSQVAVEWKQYQIRGHIDAALLFEGGRVNETVEEPAEIKTVSPNYWGKLSTLDAVIYSDFHWVRGWYGQLQGYLITNECEFGWLILVNKGTGKWHVHRVPLDLDYCEELVSKAERINQAVDSYEQLGVDTCLPPRIDGGKVCDYCNFAHICLPGRDFGPGLELVDEPELIAMLDRREELIPLHKEYGELDDRVKKMAKTHTEPFAVGCYVIEPKRIKVHFKPQPERNVEQVRVKITRVRKDGE